MVLSQPTLKLIKQYQVWYQSQQKTPEVLTIHVDEVASKVASFYEKIRGIIEWREEHLMKRAAIERILKRRLLLLENGKTIARSLVLELIRGGHFPNDQIEETKIEEVKRVLNKYLFILQKAPPTAEKLKIQLYDWLLDLASCEIEEILSPPLKEKALIDYMAELMKERIEVVKRSIVKSGISEEEKEIQIYVATKRALFKLDSPIISYYLLKKQYPNWQRLEKSQLKEISKNIYSIWQNIERDLNHPLADKFYQICEKYDTPYLILGDIISQDPLEAQKNLSQPDTLENLIRKCYQERLLRLRTRILRAALYTTISIFVTKMLIAFAIEIPFDKYILGELNYKILAFNIFIPPLLMAFLALSTRPPSEENLNRIILEIMKMVYEKDKKDVYTIRVSRKRGFILNLIINIFYLFTFFVSFGTIAWGLNKLNFGFLSIIIFLIFLSLILFAGIKIRERAKELEIVEESPGLLTFLIDSFSLPFLRVGKWLSEKLARYSFVIVFITILIDLPFQLFIEFLEQWGTFVREKKEEIH